MVQFALEAMREQRTTQIEDNLLLNLGRKPMVPPK